MLTTKVDDYHQTIQKLKKKKLEGWERALVNDLTNEANLNQGQKDLLDQLKEKYL